MIELVILAFCYVALSYFWVASDITVHYPKLKDRLFDKVASFPMYVIGRLL
jgi:hypothetical protein